MWAFGDGLMMAFIVAVTLAYITHALPMRPRAVGSRGYDGARWPPTSTPPATKTSDEADLDADEAALAAYNRMLGRLNDKDAERQQR